MEHIGLVCGVGVGVLCKVCVSCELDVDVLIHLCAGRKTLVLLGDFNMAPDTEGWCAL